MTEVKQLEMEDVYDLRAKAIAGEKISPEKLKAVIAFFRGDRAAASTKASKSKAAAGPTISFTDLLKMDLKDADGKTDSE